MKTITEPITRNQRNAWGGYADITAQTFEVEASDVKTLRQHYLGFNHRTYQFLASDVGRHITAMSDTKGWRCWSFST